MLLARGANKLGFRFGPVPRARASHWAYLFLGLGEWACAHIFQILSIINHKMIEYKEYNNNNQT